MNTTTHLQSYHHSTQHKRTIKTTSNKEKTFDSNNNKNHGLIAAVAWPKPIMDTVACSLISPMNWSWWTARIIQTTPPSCPIIPSTISWVQTLSPQKWFLMIISISLSAWSGARVTTCREASTCLRTISSHLEVGNQSNWSWISAPQSEKTWSTWIYCKINSDRVKYTDLLQNQFLLGGNNVHT